MQEDGPNRRISLGHESLARLCSGVLDSTEPAKCFAQLIRGEVSWGGGTVWEALATATRHAPLR